MIFDAPDLKNKQTNTQHYFSFVFGVPDLTFTRKKRGVDYIFLRLFLGYKYKYINHSCFRLKVNTFVI